LRVKVSVTLVGHSDPIAPPKIIELGRFAVALGETTELEFEFEFHVVWCQPVGMRDSLEDIEVDFQFGKGGSEVQIEGNGIKSA
jgi:hypothetical protein